MTIGDDDQAPAAEVPAPAAEVPAPAAEVPAAEVPAPRGPLVDEDDTASIEAEFFGDETRRRSSRGSYKLMRASIERSRMKPLPNVPKAHRTEAPWTLVSERMDGAHRWTSPTLPEAGWVTSLDRTGSFPSACSSVPVAPNALRHITAPEHLTAAARKTLAGIWLILVPVWREKGIGHPLGRLADDGPEVWVTSSHLEHLDRLAAKGRIAPVVVLEAWAGRRSTSLFERFSESVRKVYAMPPSEERTAGKTGASQAIRALWTKEAPSPWHRPDWNVSIRAEASVRHWIRADQAVTAGARLLALGATDEALVWTDDKPAAGWVPEPYILGTRFGEVKIKPAFKGAPEGSAPLTEWKESLLRGHRKR
jgi:hypothetical protein